MACVDLARKLWTENAEELKASKVGGASAPSSAGAASAAGLRQAAPNQPAEAKPAEAKKERDCVREPAAEVRRPRRRRDLPAD